VVHLTTFFGIDPTKHIPWVWGLHLGIFIVFIPILVAQGVKPQKDFWSKFFANLPTWAQYAIKAFSAYIIINFVLFIFLTKGGVPEVRDSKYVLQKHGEVIRELSEEEYELQKAYVVRGFSGHWMIFYLSPTLYFWYRKAETDVS
jgi:hypothetical protein